MANTIQFATSNNGEGTVTPVGTTSATTATLVNQHNLCPAASGASAVKLPANASGIITVRNSTGDATALLVFPPTGGSINGGTATTGNISVAAANISVLFAHSNGLDFTAIEAANAA